MIRRNPCDLPGWAKRRRAGMPLQNDMMNASVRVVGDIPDKTVVGYHRGPIGTGFLVAIESEADPSTAYSYVVTAHHILGGQSRIEVQAPSPLTIGEENLMEPEEVLEWIQPIPKMDVAIAPFGCALDRGDGVEVTAALTLDRHFLPMNCAPPLGGHVYYIGLFDPLNRAMARSGTLGALFQKDIDHDGDYSYQSHLVDCRSYKGFSGSPCYVVFSFAKLTEINLETLQLPTPPGMRKEFPLGAILDQTLLCGMFTEYIEADDSEVISRYGVGIMLPSQFILAALHTKEMVDQRREWDAMNDAEKDESGPRVKKASIQTDAGADDEFQRFQELTAQLVNTPKPKKDEAQQ